MSNRIRIGGTWQHLGSLDEYLLFRSHSVEYEHGIMYEIRFGNGILELDPEEAERLGAVLHETTTDEMHRHAMESSE